GASTYELRSPNGQLLSERSAGGTSYVLFDALGSTIGLADGAGALTATWAYDPWGNVIAKTGAGTTPVLFQGAYFDAATGLYKMGARYYDPTAGRFTQQDPIAGCSCNPQSLNHYALAGNNPINATDPTGYFCVWDLILAFAFLALAAIFMLIGIW